MWVLQCLAGIVAQSLERRRPHTQNLLGSGDVHEVYVCVATIQEEGRQALHVRAGESIMCPLAPHVEPPMSHFSLWVMPQGMICSADLSAEGMDRKTDSWGSYMENKSFLKIPHAFYFHDLTHKSVEWTRLPGSLYKCGVVLDRNAVVPFSSLYSSLVNCSSPPFPLITVWPRKLNYKNNHLPPVPLTGRLCFAYRVCLLCRHVGWSYLLAHLR